MTPIPSPNPIPQTEEYEFLTEVFCDSIKHPIVLLDGTVESNYFLLVSAYMRGRENVIAISMPMNAQESLENDSVSWAFAKELGIEPVCLPIANIVNAFNNTLFKFGKGKEHFSEEIKNHCQQRKIKELLQRAIENQFNTDLYVDHGYHAVNRFFFMTNYLVLEYAKEFVDGKAAGFLTQEQYQKYFLDMTEDHTQSKYYHNVY